MRCVILFLSSSPYCSFAFNLSNSLYNPISLSLPNSDRDLNQQNSLLLLNYTINSTMREPTMVVGMDATATSAALSSSPPHPSPPPQALLERLKDYGQEDAFALWDELSPEERDFLVKDIEVELISIDWVLVWINFFLLCLIVDFSFRI